MSKYTPIDVGIKVYDLINTTGDEAIASIKRLQEKARAMGFTDIDIDIDFDSRYEHLTVDVYGIKEDSK